MVADKRYAGKSNTGSLFSYQGKEVIKIIPDPLNSR